MRLPVRAIVANLVWTTHGTVVAVWRIAPATYPYLPDAAKHDLHARTRAALRALGTEATILSLCRAVGPEEVAGAACEGVDLARHPAWAAAVGAQLDDLAGLECWRRELYVTAELAQPGPSAALRSALGAGRARVTARFGLPAAPPGRAEVAAAGRAAAEIERRLRRALAVNQADARRRTTVRAATAAEVWWCYARAPRRGLGEPECPAGPRLPRGTLASLGEPVFTEGGDATDVDRPRFGRYLRVESEAGRSWQAYCLLADLPARFAFPGGAEWLARAELAPFPVDVATRIRALSNSEAQVRTRRQHRRLVAQTGEYEGELAGAPPELGDALEAIEDERAELAANPTDPEFHVATAFCVWGEDLATVESRTAALRAQYETGEYALPRPLGSQAEAYTLFLPGAPTPSVARDYTQFLLPRDLAAAMPFAGTEVGDPAGALWAVGLDGGTVRPVYLDPAYGPAIGRSGSAGIVGALGSGKSYAAKCLAWATVARGGAVVAIDRDGGGEWTRLAPVMAGRSAVVAVGDAAVCLDPLRVFRDATGATDAGVRAATGFATLATRTPPSDPEGVVLSQAVRAVAERGGDARDLPTELATRAAAGAPGAELAAAKVANLAADPMAAPVFGDGEPLALDADYVVFWLTGLRLPSREVLLSEHLARQLLPEQLISQALLYVVAAVGRSLIFADPARFGALVLDEAWALTSSLEGQQLVAEAVREGRKHNAGVWLSSQVLRDLGDRDVRELLTIRLGFRQSAAAAAECWGWIGTDATPERAALAASLGAGQCLLRDVSDDIGLVQVLEAPDLYVCAACGFCDTDVAAHPCPAPLASLRAALDTTPGEADIEAA